jgi:hypothetical protein
MMRGAICNVHHAPALNLLFQVAGVMVRDASKVM